jgi:hypothetical protein
LVFVSLKILLADEITPTNKTLLHAVGVDAF